MNSIGQRSFETEPKETLFERNTVLKRKTVQNKKVRVFISWASHTIHQPQPSERYPITKHSIIFQRLHPLPKTPSFLFSLTTKPTEIPHPKIHPWDLFHSSSARRSHTSCNGSWLITKTRVTKAKKRCTKSHPKKRSFRLFWLLASFLVNSSCWVMM